MQLSRPWRSTLEIETIVVANEARLAQELKSSSPWNRKLSESLRCSWPASSEACTHSCRPLHCRIYGCGGGSRGRPEGNHDKPLTQYTLSDLQCSCDFLAGKSVRCQTCTACHAPSGSQGYPASQVLVSNHPSQELWSSHSQNQSHMLSQQSSQTTALSQHRLSAASHLTPAEELIYAINKLNIKMEQSELHHGSSPDIADASQKTFGASSQSPPDRVLSTTKQYRALHRLRQGLIGHSHQALTPFGSKLVVYADWAASGRLLWQVVYQTLHTEPH